MNLWTWVLRRVPDHSLFEIDFLKQLKGQFLQLVLRKKIFRFDWMLLQTKIILCSGRPIYDNITFSDSGYSLTIKSRDWVTVGSEQALFYFRLFPSAFDILVFLQAKKHRGGSNDQSKWLILEVSLSLTKCLLDHLHYSTFINLHKSFSAWVESSSQ